MGALFTGTAGGAPAHEHRRCAPVTRALRSCAGEPPAVPVIRRPNFAGYSLRSAVVGSNPAARRAGSHEAITAMNRNSTATDTNVTGSVGFTPTSILASTRVSANAPINPIIIPIALR